jgi:hypothetical protein
MHSVAVDSCGMATAAGVTVTAAELFDDWGAYAAS